MSIITVHVTGGIYRFARTDDPTLTSVEVIAVVDGAPVSCLRPAFEDAIIRFVGEARERQAVQLAETALQALKEQIGPIGAFANFDTAEAEWHAVRTEADRSFAAARRLLYEGPPASTPAFARPMAAE